MLLSIVAVILAIIGSMGYDPWLASTQWVLVAVLLAIWAVYARPCDCCQTGRKEE